MGNAKVRTMDVASPTETLATSRKSGWFSFSDLDRSATIRRLNARYTSGKDITVKIYADGDSSNHIFSGTLRPNDGESGALLGDVNHMNSTTTTLPTLSTTKLQDDDWIKIDNEIMKIITAGTTSHTVERGKRGTTAATHNNNSKIYYANYQNDSLRVGRRAKYALVEIGTAADTTSTEINKMEIEYQ
tara:strand:- start:10344 stop:10907 length:564 start_codon:yes stop_codon:yes gene_type:complete